MALPGARSASGAENAAPFIPYFASLKSDETNMREGPNEKSRVRWIYHRKGLPVEVLATFDVWRRVKDMDGEIGWIHVALLSRDRTAMIAAGADAQVRSSAEAGSDIVAEAKPGAIGKLVDCGPSACEVRFDEASGWIDRDRLWGVRDGQDY
jgi:SH3-like domain-containing protein